MHLGVWRLGRGNLILSNGKLKVHVQHPLIELNRFSGIYGSGTQRDECASDGSTFPLLLCALEHTAIHLVTLNG